MNKFLGIFGNPVDHSISPLLHNYTIHSLNLQGCYTKVNIEDANRIKEQFFNYGFSGINITVPHKEVAYNICDEIKGIAKDIKAVNTIIQKENKLIGFNTDAPGFYESIKEFNNIKKALILGAGGTAKAISIILRNNHIEPVILNRSQNRISFFKDNGFRAYSWNEFRLEHFDIIINTTSAGLNDDLLPLKKELLKKLIKSANYCIDVIYNKQTPFLKLSKELNKPSKDGSDMLLYQAVLAFLIFFEFDISKKHMVEKAMKKAMSLL